MTKLIKNVFENLVRFSPAIVNCINDICKQLNPSNHAPIELVTANSYQWEHLRKKLTEVAQIKASTYVQMLENLKFDVNNPIRSVGELAALAKPILMILDRELDQVITPLIVLNYMLTGEDQPEELELVDFDDIVQEVKDQLTPLLKKYECIEFTSLSIESYLKPQVMTESHSLVEDVSINEMVVDMATECSQAVARLEPEREIAPAGAVKINNAEEWIVGVREIRFTDKPKEDMICYISDDMMSLIKCYQEYYDFEVSGEILTSRLEMSVPKEVEYVYPSSFNHPFAQVKLHTDGHFNIDAFNIYLSEAEKMRVKIETKEVQKYVTLNQHEKQFAKMHPWPSYDIIIRMTIIGKLKRTIVPIDGFVYMDSDMRLIKYLKSGSKFSDLHKFTGKVFIEDPNLGPTKLMTRLVGSKINNLPDMITLLICWCASLAHVKSGSKELIKVKNKDKLLIAKYAKLGLPGGDLMLLADLDKIGGFKEKMELRIFSGIIHEFYKDIQRVKRFILSTECGRETIRRVLGFPIRDPFKDLHEVTINPSLMFERLEWRSTNEIT